MSKAYSSKGLILSSIFASLTAICSAISIPLPFSPIPINLALLSVYLAGGLLGPRLGALSQTIYVLLGALGLPVFHNLTGGLSILIGPTGGFLIGYIAAAFFAGLAHRYRLRIKALVTGIGLGLFVCYFLGTLWFVFISGTGILSALTLCVLPFLPGDFLKIIAAIVLIKKLQPIVSKIHG
jgi:biotin transport system substrate-specific component